MTFLNSEMGKTRIESRSTDSGSARFDRVFQKPVRVRFGSTEFSKSLFGFGSVRFDSAFKISVRVRFGLSRTEPNRYSSVRVRFVFGLCLVHDSKRKKGL